MNSVVFFLVTIAVLIVVHEWGHYRVAVACGVKVLRFSIGFGRPLIRRQRGETEWVLSLLPLGGYVKMLDEREGPVDPAERDRAFNRKSLGRRAAIVLAGPVANLLLAVALYALSFWIGTSEPRALLGTPPAATLAAQADVRAGDHVLRLIRSADGEAQDVLSLTDLRWHLTRAALDGADVDLEVVRQGTGGVVSLHLPLASLEATDADPALMRRIGIGAPYAEPVLGEVIAGGAGARAGLRLGDRVLSIDGRPMADAAAVRTAIRAAVPPTGGASEATQASAAPIAAPAAAALDTTAAAGAEASPTESPAAEAAPLPPGAMVWRIERAGRIERVVVQPAVVDDRGQRVGRIEAVVGAAVQIDTVRLGPIDGLLRGFDRTVEMSALTLKMFGRMLIGEASLRNLSGPLSIAEYAGQSAQLGLAYYLGFLAVVSVSLGILNLLPLPMLDGGHLVYYLVEGVIGRPVPDAWIERLQRGGLVVILLMMSLALYNDVARLMGLH